MGFRHPLHLLLDCILEGDPSLWTEFLITVDLEDMYMHIWVQISNTPSVVLLISNEREDDENIMEFYLSIPMVYVELEPLFCASTEKVKYTVNNTTQDIKYPPEHPLEGIAETPTDK